MPNPPGRSPIGMPRGRSAAEPAGTTPLGAPRWRSATVWALQVLAALVFLGAGGAKLFAADAMIALFDRIGIGQWLRLLTGALEVAGALLMLWPTAASAGALLLACVMGGATLTHLVLIGGSPVPAIALLMLTAVIAWLRRPQPAAAGGRFRDAAALMITFPAIVVHGAEPSGRIAMLMSLLIQTCFTFAVGIFTTLSLLERPIWRLMRRPMDKDVPNGIVRTIHADLQRLIPLLPPTMVTTMTVGAVLLVMQAWQRDFDLPSTVIVAVFTLAQGYLFVELKGRIRGVREVPNDGPIEPVRTGLGRLVALHHGGLATTAAVAVLQLVLIGSSL